MRTTSRNWLRITLAVAALAVSLPLLAFAQPRDVEGLIDKLCVIAGWIFTIAMITGIALIMFAGFKYMTAGGDAERFKTANKALLYGVIGLAVALLARSAPYIVGSFVGANTTPAGTIGQSLSGTNRAGCRQ